MPNFIVPVVGNPNGGFQNGDQVTAENLNAHVIDAVPTGEFISGRDESTTTNSTDYYLKVESDGNLKKIASSYIGANANTADHSTIKVGTITSRTGDGSATAYGSIALNNTGNLTFSLGAYNDPLNYNSGTFTVNASIQSFQYRAPIASGNSNLFVIGDESKASTFVCYAQTAAFRNTWPLDLSYNKKAFILPSGTTSERPVAGNGLGGVSSGMLRFNSETNDIEFYANEVWNGFNSRATGLRTGNVGTNGAGIVYRSTLEFDIPSDETWLFTIDAHWSTPASGNTQPGYWFETAIFATKATYTDVELKRYCTNYTPYSGINRFNVTIPLTKALLGNLSKKIEVRTYVTMNSTTLATFSQLGAGKDTNWYSVRLVKLKTADFNSVNAIL